MLSSSSPLASANVQNTDMVSTTYSKSINDESLNLLVDAERREREILHNGSRADT